MIGSLRESSLSLAITNQKHSTSVGYRSLSFDNHIDVNTLPLLYGKHNGNVVSSNYSYNLNQNIKLLH